MTERTILSFQGDYDISNMKEYFPHDYNARNDPKLQDVMMRIGVAGIGIYWCLVEQLYEQGGRLPVGSIPSIAFCLHVDPGMVESIIKDFGLFECDDDFFWSASASMRIDKRNEIIEVRRMAGRLGGLKTQANAKQMLKQNSSTAKAIKENKSKVNIDLNNIYKKDKENIPLSGDIKEREKNLEPGGSVSLPADPLPKNFKKPSVEDVAAYCRERNNGIDAEAFVDFYNSKGWKIGNSAMKDWEAAVRTWERKEKDYKNGQSHGNDKYGGRRGYTDFKSTSADDYEGPF